jgi:predicted nucleotidyltransferase component of viral defense system
VTKAPKNIGASVRARLLRLAEEHGEDFQLVLVRYANERLLYRLAKSEHASSFVLKGAALFTLWTGRPHRATRDLDLLGFGESTEDRVRRVFTEVIAVGVPDDGVVFDVESLDVGPIREDQEYGGIRVLLRARITTAQVRLQIDVGFGDAITPAAETVEFPALLDFEPPSLRAYPRETVVAEKLEAMVKLGMANSRMKDFYDVWLLSRTFEFDGDMLARAIRATFDRRRTPLPAGLPVALTPEFAADATKRTQWRAFLRKSSAGDAGELAEVVAAIALFAERPFEIAASAEPWEGRWPAGGPWK